MATIYGANTLSTGYDVANSLRFNFSDDPRLSRTLSTPTNADKYTFSAWVKRDRPTTSAQDYAYLISFDIGGTLREHIRFSTGGENDQLSWYIRDSGSTATSLTTSAQFRDISAWYHVCCAYDSTQSTSSNRQKIYINGTQITSFSSSGYVSQNQDSPLNTSGHAIKIGSLGNAAGTTGNFSGHMAEICFIDGQALDATSFGEFDNSSPNIWKPIDVSGLTFGNNGFHLDFENGQTGFVDSSSNARAITVTGDTNHSFDQAKFDSSSIYFDGTNDSLDIADSTDFDFGTGDFTFEFFVYKTSSGKMAIFETRSSGSNNGFNLEFSAADKFEWYDQSIASGGDLPKDPSAISLNTWTHYAVVRNGTSCKMYRDGSEVGTAKDVGSNSMVSAGTPTIGESAAGANDFQGYLDEIRLSSTARYTSNFSVPTSSFTSDSDTVLLIQSKASNLIGADVSGQGNHFQSHDFDPYDQSTDTCTNNGCTLMNASGVTKTYTLSEGNLKATASASNWHGVPRGTIGVSSGKWYYEVKVTDQNSNFMVGYMSASNIADVGDRSTNGFPKLNGFQSSGYIKRQDDTEVNVSSSFDFDDGDIAQIALDMDNKKLWIGKNGTYYNSGDPSAGSNETIGSSYFTDGEAYLPALIFYGTNDGSFNFGDAPYTISSGNQDPNGYGNFEYETEGFYTLNSKNLAEFG